MDRNSELGTRHGGIRRRAFTLVELVVVIAIIAGVAAILLPTIGKIKREVQKVQDILHLKKIAEAYKIYIERYEESLDGFKSETDRRHLATLLAQRLAGYGKSTDDVILNDPSIYISSSDKYASKPGKAICILNNGAMTWASGGISWNNAPVNSFSSNPHQLFSYCLICNLPIYAKEDTTPIAFTRGLCEDGYWHETYGLYGDSGGYVAFADGHVKWFDGKRPTRFLKWDQSGYTTNIREAIPNIAGISIGDGYDDQYPQVKNKNNSTMIIRARGTGGEE